MIRYDELTLENMQHRKNESWQDKIYLMAQSGDNFFAIQVLQSAP